MNENALEEVPVEIVLVEDDALDAELAILAIRQAHFAGRVTHIEDGAKALQYLSCACRGRARRVVFLDIKLPRIDGIEVLRRLKCEEATRTIPVIMLSSSAECMDIDQCYRLGANSYVVKPARFDAYEARVAGLVQYWVRINQPELALQRKA